MTKINNDKEKLSNIEIITLAVYLTGGTSSYVDTEDVAMKANEIAPGRFSWRKYPEQVNIGNVEKRLYDAKIKTGFLLGTRKKGWILSELGFAVAKEKVETLKTSNLSRTPANKREMAWKNREKERMLASTAYEKYTAGKKEEITVQEAEAFFRVNDYVTGIARKERLTRVQNAFGKDPLIGELVNHLMIAVRKK
jgi:hypothetical protein